MTRCLSSSLLDAYHHNNKGCPPIWLMRQAGRYMPQYQNLRRKYSIETLFRHADLISEVTLLPIELLDADAAIIFSDILIALDGLGILWKVEPGIGPLLEKPCDISMQFTAKDPTRVYAPLGEAIGQLKQQLKVPLLGFVGAPFTLATYLLEGRSTREFKKTKKALYSDPKAFEAYLNHLADELIRLANYQIDCGVDAIQIFDTHAAELGTGENLQMALRPLKRIMEAIGSRVAVTLFARHSSFLANEHALLNPTALSVDWTVDLKTLRQTYPHLTLQGNLDPAVLLGSHKCIAEKIKAILVDMQGDAGYIFNLGHGVLPETPFENVQFLIDYVRHHYR